MTIITRQVLAHKRLVAAFWIVITVIGMATVSQSTKSFSKQFSVPGRPGYETNNAILKTFHQGGRDAALL
jgi:putative drug exporter of the RND superfamily